MVIAIIREFAAAQRLKSFGNLRCRSKSLKVALALMHKKLKFKSKVVHLNADNKP